MGYCLYNQENFILLFKKFWYIISKIVENTIIIDGIPAIILKQGTYKYKIHISDDKETQNTIYKVFYKGEIKLICIYDTSCCCKIIPKGFEDLYIKCYNL